MEQSIAALRRKMGKDVAVLFVHFPLPSHRFARPAARAAECAAEQGRFEAMHDELFDKQDSLGLKSWDSFARDAGVENLHRFERCVLDTSAVPRIDSGVALGMRLHVRGTPTILINGWQYWGLQPGALEGEVEKRRAEGGR